MLQRHLAPWAEHVYAVTRIALGLMFSFHGIQKVFGILTDKVPALGSQIWIGGVIELVCGSLLALGLFTRFAAFLSSGTMAVAYTQFHWELQGWPEILPAINRGELALVYSFVFLFMACKGPGLWSLDAPTKVDGPSSRPQAYRPQL